MSVRPIRHVRGLCSNRWTPCWPAMTPARGYLFEANRPLLLATLGAGAMKTGRTGRGFRLPGSAGDVARTDPAGAPKN